MGFEVALVPTRDLKRVLQYNISLTKTLVHVAFAPGEPGKSVMHIEGELVVGRAVISRHVRVEQRRARSHRFKWIEHRRQFFIVHSNARQRFFRGIERLRSHRGHSIADKAHQVPAQNRHVANLLTDKMIAEFLTRDNGFDSWHTTGMFHIDATNSRVGARAAENFSPERSRQTNIGGVYRATAHF